MAGQSTSKGPPPVTIFLCGDVMTGRGIDQVLPHPSDPRIHEDYAKSALDYVELAERVNGPIPQPVSYSYIWGAALKEFERVKPQVRIINLETSVTTSDDWLPKGINYRMHPRNLACITAASIDCCVMANNHVLDFGYSGLAETLHTLQKANLKPVGAGQNLAEAWEPAALKASGGSRILVLAVGTESSGIPESWAATEKKAGVAFLSDMSQPEVRRITERVRAIKRPGDVVVVSIHWGGNWGYHIPPEHQAFAHSLIDQAGADIIHGHSSHHPKGIEVYKGKPILYGCGDFLNDYEGISGYEQFRSHLVLMYFVTVHPSTGNLVRFEMTPLQTKRFQLVYASQQDAEWLQNMLTREGRPLGTRTSMNPDNTLMLEWR